MGGGRGPLDPSVLLFPAYITVFIDFLGYSSTVVILPYISIEQNATAFEVMCATTGIFYAGQIVGSTIMGYVSDKIGRRPVILMSLLGCCVSYIWCIYVQDVYELMAARLMGGIMGGTLPVVQAMVLDVVKDPVERAGCLSRVNASFGMAFAVGPALGTLINEKFGKRAVFVATALITCACSLYAAAKLTETNFSESKSRIHRNPNHSSLPREVFIGALAMFATAYAFSALTSALPLFYVPLFDWRAKELGLVATAFGVSMAINNILFTKVYGKFHTQNNHLYFFENSLCSLSSLSLFSHSRSLSSLSLSRSLSLSLSLSPLSVSSLCLFSLSLFSL
ncbi:hypothetical protein AAMO2058_000173100 [Amorphochlora amoebiformis]